MMSAIRHRLRAARGEHGFTLIEMLTVVFLLGIIIAVSMGELAGAQGTTRNNAYRVDQTQQAKAAIETMSKELRTAVLPSQILGSCSGCSQAAFLSANWNSVQFYANVDNPSNTVGPSQVSYTLQGSASPYALVEVIRPPDAHAATDYNYQYTCTNGVGSCHVYTRTIASSVVASATNPLFAYYDYSGNLLTVPITGAANLANVDSVSLSLTVQANPRQQGSTVLTHVTLPNADALVQSTASPS
jgi:prepilin-type N-terminal cleavage/methylation domain-containing protein